MKKRAICLIMTMLLAFSLIPVVPAEAAMTKEDAYTAFYNFIQDKLKNDKDEMFSAVLFDWDNDGLPELFYGPEKDIVGDRVIHVMKWNGNKLIEFGSAFIDFSDLNKIDYYTGANGKRYRYDLFATPITNSGETVGVYVEESFSNIENYDYEKLTDKNIWKGNVHTCKSNISGSITYQEYKNRYNNYTAGGEGTLYLGGSDSLKATLKELEKYARNVPLTPKPGVKYVYTFYDVPETHVYARAIHWAVAHNIAWGTSNTSFSPDATCTRGQVVTFLWRFSGQPEPTINVNPFTDVNESDYFYKPVLWAVEQGITSGTTPTSFSPNAKCSYAHIGTFLWRAAGKQAPTNERYSHDLWYGDALNWDIDTLKAGYLYKNIKPMSDCPRGVVIQGIKDLDTYFDHLDDEPSTTDE